MIISTVHAGRLRKVVFTLLSVALERLHSLVHQCSGSCLVSRQTKTFRVALEGYSLQLSRPFVVSVVSLREHWQLLPKLGVVS